MLGDGRRREGPEGGRGGEGEQTEWYIAWPTDPVVIRSIPWFHYMSAPKAENDRCSRGIEYGHTRTNLTNTVIAHRPSREGK